MATAMFVALIFAQIPTQDAVSAVREFIDQYCVRCHNSSRRSGSIDLTGFRDEFDFRQRSDLYEKVLRSTESLRMPPPYEPQPSDDLLSTFTTSLSALVASTHTDQCVPIMHVPMRRLCEHELERTIRDFLHVDCSLRWVFTGAALGSCFDNVGETLTSSTSVASKYTDAASDVVERFRQSGETARALFGALGDSDLIRTPEGANSLLTSMLSRGFRRPPTDDELNSRVHLLEEGLKSGKPPIDAILTCVESILLSPSFLFRVEIGEHDAGDGVERLSDFELASRLSYFLWSTMPDEELFEVASKNKLRDADQLRTQLRRLLTDQRSSALAEHFAVQWLDLTGRTETASSTADDRLRASATAEGVWFFNDLIRRDLSVLRLIDCEETFVNDDLAALYGVDGDFGDSFHLAKLPDSHRAGVLGMSAILSRTSLPSRTSVPRRGRFILDRLLGRAVASPPPSVSRFSDAEVVAPGTSMRKRLERHLVDSSCVSCHVEMDAIGIALENFDQRGAWREMDLGIPIDAGSVLPSGVVLDGPESLRTWLTSQKHLFVRSLVCRLFTYAVGREPGFVDDTTIESIITSAESSNYRFSSLVEGIVLSKQFRFMVRCGTMRSSDR